MKSNPWKGLRPYEFDDAGAFYGRNTEILQLTSLIEYNSTVTLYGKSGIGKSSLLRAGVFPWLKLNGYNCNYLRLNELDANSSSFIDRIQALINLSVGSVVIVLDQFEEVLRSNLSQTELLLKHIAFNKFSCAEGCNLHFVISIREDDFFLLEDSIDRNSLNSLKSNRFRLKELSYESAKDIITLPKEDLFDENEANIISDKIISAVKNLCNDEISTVFLSFICSRIYLTFQKDRISASDIDEFLNEKIDFLSLFFEELKQKLNDDVAWQFLENNLVANDGRRTVAKSSDFNLIFKENKHLLLDGDYSILRVVTFRGNECVELIHDILAVYLLAYRNERIEHENLLRKQHQSKIFLRNVICGAVILLIVNVILIFSIYKINQSEDNFLLNESRYLAYAADDILEGNENFTLPLRLMLYALPENLKNPSRPHSIEAEAIFRQTDLKLGISPINYIIDFRGIINSEISSDDKYILLSNESKVGLYDSYTGKEISTMTFDKKLLNAKFKQSSNNVLLAFEDFTVRELNLLESTKDVSLVRLPSFPNKTIGFANYSNDGSVIAYSPGWSRDSIYFFSFAGNKVVSKIPYSLVFNYSGGTSYHSPKLLAFSRNAINFLQTYHSGYARIYNIETSSDITPEGLIDAEDIKYCNFASDYFIVTHHKNNVIKFWDLKKGECIHELLPDFDVADFCINKGGDRMIINSKVSGNGKIFDLKTLSYVNGDDSDHNGIYMPFQKGYFCPDSSLLLISKLGTQIHYTRNSLVNNNDNYLRNKVFTHFSSNGKFVLSQEENYVYCFNLNNLKQSFRYTNIVKYSTDKDHYVSHQLIAASFSEYGNLLYLITSDGCLYEFDVLSGKMLGEHMIAKQNFSVYTFSSDKKYLAVSDHGYDGTNIHIIVYDLRTKEIISKIDTGERHIREIHLHPDGGLILYITYNNEMAVHNYSKDGLKSTVPLKLLDIDFCHDNNLAVTLNSESEFSIWNLSDKSEKLKVSLPNKVQRVSISKNGKFIVTISNHRVRVWDVDSGNELKEKTLEDKEFINYAQFSDDCNYLIVHTSGGIRIFDFNKLYELYPGVLKYCRYHEFIAQTNNILLFDSDNNLRLYNILPYEEMVSKYRNDKSRDWTLSESEIDYYKLNSKYQ